MYLRYDFEDQEKDLVLGEQSQKKSGKQELFILLEENKNQYNAITFYSEDDNN
jgi:hypothetical protein